MHVIFKVGYKPCRGTLETPLLIHSSLRRQDWGQVRPGKCITLISICVDSIWGQVRLGYASVPVNMHENQDRVWAIPSWAGLQHRTGELRLWMDSDKLCQSTHQHAQDLGLGMGLVRKLLRLLYWAAAPTGEFRNWSCGRIMFGTVAASIGMHVGWVSRCAKLDSSIYQCL